MALSLVIGGSGSGTKVAVPNVVGQPQAQAEQTLKALEFRVVSAQIVVDGVEGAVFSQDPLANTVANRKSTIKLFIIQNPEIPVNIGQTLTEIQAAVDLVETDAAAGTRQAAVLAKLAEVETTAKADERNLAVVAKLEAIESKLGTVESKVDLVETDAQADVRNQAVLDKLETVESKVDLVETDEDAEQRKQEILEKIEEHDDHDHDKGTATAARKSSSTRKSS
jgi:hypothetical protein